MSPHAPTGPRLIVATLGVALGLLLAALDQTIVGTAMPRVVEELKGLDYYAWVTTGYLVTSTVTVPIAGKLGDLFGRKPFVMVGILGFMAASAICGASQNMAELVIFRGVQGLFGGFLFASVFTTIRDLFPPERMGRIQGVFGGVFGLSSIIGPTAGGFITDNWGWRWVFYVNLPVGLLSAAMILAALPFVRSKATWKDIDFVGAVVMTLGLVPLLIGLSITRDHAWTSPEVSGLLAFAIVMLGVFYVIERRAKEPIVPFELFKNNAFTVSTVMGFLIAFAMFGSIIFVPLIFQGVLGVSATNSGTLMTPMMLGLVVTSVAAGQLIYRIRYYRLLGTAGVALVMVGLYLLSQVSVDTPSWQVTRDIVLIGAGIGFTFPLALIVVQAGLPYKFIGVASSQVQFWRNVGGTVGTAILGSILSNRLPGAIKDRVGELHLPPQATSRLTGGGGSPQALFDPARIAATRAQLPAALQPAFDSVLHAIRLALADTLHDLFLIGLAASALALVATLFLKEVPLKRGAQPAAVPVPQEPEEAAATA